MSNFHPREIFGNVYPVKRERFERFLSLHNFTGVMVTEKYSIYEKDGESIEIPRNSELTKTQVSDLLNLYGTSVDEFETFVYMELMVEKSAINSPK